MWFYDRMTGIEKNWLSEMHVLGIGIRLKGSSKGASLKKFLSGCNEIGTLLVEFRYKCDALAELF